MGEELLHFLLQDGAIGYNQARQVRSLSERWGVPSHRLVRLLNFAPPELYREAYSRIYKIPPAPAERLEWDSKLEQAAPWKVWLHAMALPVRHPELGSLILAVDPANLPEELKKTGRPARLILEEEWLEWISRLRGRELVDQAVCGLERKHPEYSARRTFSSVQIAVFALLCSGLAAGLFFSPLATGLIVYCFVNLFFFCCVIFKTVLVLVGAGRKTAQKISEKELKGLAESDLPVYTVLVPVYREARTIPHLIRHLSDLEYPLAKLDIKVLLEEEDTETIEAFRKSCPPPNFQAVIVPKANPKTKPKACNYGLLLARGEFLTIYDAEDLPEPDQLKKVVAAFRKLPREVICIQAALNYFNWRENFLTRMFTLEYSNWFDYMLPGMEALGFPIPLGGTSNHFRLERLQELGGWDPFNVTEDADLGLRANARGFRVVTIDSTTYEEANRAYGNWIRQRSRWVKGYLQTFLVHIRHPVRLIRSSGIASFTGFCLFIGGTPFIFLCNPVLWALFLVWLVTRAEWFEQIAPAWLLFISFFNLLLGNFMAVYVCILGVFKRKNYALGPYALLNPLYWMLHAVASLKAVWQLFVNPFYWEKTEHGITRVKAVLPGGTSTR